MIFLLEIICFVLAIFQKNGWKYRDLLKFFMLLLLGIDLEGFVSLKNV